MTFTVGGVDVAAVHVGATAAEAVYLGADKVWPTAAPPSGYQSAILSANPAGYWRLGESSGTVAYDSSGNGRDGDYKGSALRLGEPGLVAKDADPSMYAINTSYMTVPNGAWFDKQSVISWECLVKRQVLGGTRDIVTNRLDVSTFARLGSWQVRFNAADIQVIATNTVGDNWRVQSRPGGNDHDVHHLAGVIDEAGSGSFSLILDGVILADRAAMGGPINISGTVGSKLQWGHATGEGTSLAGWLDEAVIYDYAVDLSVFAQHAALALGP